MKLALKVLLYQLIKVILETLNDLYFEIKTCFLVTFECNGCDAKTLLKTKRKIIL